VFLVHLYGTLLLLLLLGLGIANVFLFMYTDEPPASAWANSKIETTGMTFSFVKTNNIRLNVITAGPTTGKTVVLLHGFPETALISWHYHIRLFAEKGYHVVAPDMRGYNTSDKPPAVMDYLIDELAADIAGVFDHFKQEKVILVGHDWGAAVAFRVALLYPSRVEKLGILNVPHPLVMENYLKGSFEQLRKSWYIFFFQLPYLPEMKLNMDNYRFGSSILGASGIKGKSFSLDALNRLKESWAIPDALGSMVNYYRAVFRGKFSVKKVDPMVQPKTLILWGKDDIALSFEMAEITARDYLKDGKLIPLEATHWVQHDRPEEVASYLLKFFEEK